MKDEELLPDGPGVSTKIIDRDHIFGWKFIFYGWFLLVLIIVAILFLSAPVGASYILILIFVSLLILGLYEKRKSPKMD